MEQKETLPFSFHSIAADVPAHEGARDRIGGGYSSVEVLGRRTRDSCRKTVLSLVWIMWLMAQGSAANKQPAMVCCDV